MSNKETVVQFGEGTFLRGFVDYFFQKMNDRKLFDGYIVVVSDERKNSFPALKKQNGKYNLFLRGTIDGKVVCEHTEINVISRCIDPYESFEDYLKLAESSDIKYIVSYTQPNRMRFLDIEVNEEHAAISFPAKLTQLLYKRYTLGLDGFTILPCEPIVGNADILKQLVLTYAKFWALGKNFENWVAEKNRFCNTFADRICMGAPSSDDREISGAMKHDVLADTAELYHLWAVQGDLEYELPFHEAGCNVVWTNDVKYYIKRKNSIFSGGRILMAPGARLYGLDTKCDCMNDETVSDFLKKCIFDEIIPAIGSTTSNIYFAKDMLQRFENPYTEEELLSICRKLTDKFQKFVLPSIILYKEKFGSYPVGLSFSFASLIAFYKTREPDDSDEIKKFMRESDVSQILENRELWKTDITDMTAVVEKYYKTIMMLGMRRAYRSIMS